MNQVFEMCNCVRIVGSKIDHIIIKTELILELQSLIAIFPLLFIYVISIYLDGDSFLDPRDSLLSKSFHGMRNNMELVIESVIDFALYLY